MKTIEDLVAAIEARYPCVDGIHAGACQTGDHYVTIGEPRSGADEQEVGESGAPPGTVPEGAARELHVDLETAVWSAWNSFCSYADWWHREHSGESPRIYWRYVSPRAFLMTRPRTRRKASVCYVRMRLVLSAKPDLAEFPPSGFPSVPDQETWDA